MNEEDDYYHKLIILAFDSALFVYGEEYLKVNPGLLLSEMESLSNLYRHIATINANFKNQPTNEEKVG